MQVVENLLVPVVGRVGIVADELANAAAVRGIDAPNRRTSYYELHIGAADALLLAYFAAIAGVSAALGAGEMCIRDRRYAGARTRRRPRVAHHRRDDSPHEGR